MTAWQGAAARVRGRRGDIRTALGYGIGDFGLNLYWNSISLLLLFWYVHVAGLSPATAGTVFFLATLWDAITDVLMASLAERTRSRFGSYRVYLPFGGAALAVSFFLLFWVPPLAGVFLVSALLCTHILFRTCYTLVAVPYSALMSRITLRSDVRTWLSGCRMTFAYAGFLAVSSTAFPIVKLAGNGSAESAQGWLVLGAVFALLGTTCLLVTFATTREGPAPAGTPTSLQGVVRDAIISVKKNRALRSLLAMMSLHSCANLTFFATLVFFIDSYKEWLVPQERVLLLVGLLMIATVPAWTATAAARGKRWTWIAASGLASAACLHLAFAGPVIVAGFPVQVFFVAGSSSGFGVLVWSMIPDVVEYGHWRTGVRSESAAFGVSLFVQKASMGAAALFSGALLGWAGVDGSLGAVIPERVAFVLGLPAALFWILSAIAACLHPVSAVTHAAAVSGLSEGRSA